MSRRSEQPCFPAQPGDPAPLMVAATRRVRFEEVDALGIVWHGRYPSYLEDGRSAFGDHHGLAYLDMAAHRYLGPIVSMHLDYHSPLSFGEEMRIETTAHWSEAVKLLFSYRILGPGGRLACTAHTVQLLLDMDRRLLLAYPEHLEAFRQRWRQGGLK